MPSIFIKQERMVSCGGLSLTKILGLSDYNKEEIVIYLYLIEYFIIRVLHGKIC